jgi:hypothetical protein
MRNLTAEAKIINKLFTLAGALVLTGLVGLLVFFEVWILVNFIGLSFWLMQFFWAVVAGLVIAFVAGVCNAAIIADINKIKF